MESRGRLTRENQNINIHIKKIFKLQNIAMGITNYANFQINADPLQEKNNHINLLVSWHHSMNIHKVYFNINLFCTTVYSIDCSNIKYQIIQKYIKLMHSSEEETDYKKIGLANTFHILNEIETFVNNNN